MPTRNFDQAERQHAMIEKKAKLAALRAAAKHGMTAVEAGDARTFASIDALERHLNDVASNTMGKTKR